MHGPPARPPLITFDTDVPDDDQPAGWGIPHPAGIPEAFLTREEFLELAARRARRRLPLFGGAPVERSPSYSVTVKGQPRPRRPSELARETSWKKHRHDTKTRRRALERLARQGVTGPEAERLARQRRLEAPPNGGWPPAPEDKRRRAVELYASGLSLRQVGEEVGLHKKTVLAILKKAGVPRRPEGRRRRPPMNWPRGENGAVKLNQDALTVAPAPDPP